MCGIIAAFNTTPKGKDGKKMEDRGPVNEFIIAQYDQQRKRGTEGFGIIRIGDDGYVDIDRAINEMKFVADLTMPHKESRGIIAHHRNPTSSANDIQQTHPFLVDIDGHAHKYLVVHNGSITNTEDLHKKHFGMKIEYNSEHEEVYSQSYSKSKWNDSESLAIELALLMEGKQKFLGTAGGAAFVGIQLNPDWKATKLFFGRNTMPLKMSKTRGKLRLSSVGEGQDVEADFLYQCDLDEDMDLKKSKLEFVAYEHPKPVAPPSDKKEATSDSKTGSLDLVAKVIGNADEDKATDKALEAALTEECGEFIVEQVLDFAKTVKDQDADFIEYALDERIEKELDTISEIVNDHGILLQHGANDSIASVIRSIVPSLILMRKLSSRAMAEFSIAKHFGKTAEDANLPVIKGTEDPDTGFEGIKQHLEENKKDDLKQEADRIWEETVGSTKGKTTKTPSDQALRILSERLGEYTPGKPFKKLFNKPETEEVGGNTIHRMPAGFRTESENKAPKTIAAEENTEEDLYSLNNFAS